MEKYLRQLSQRSTSLRQLQLVDYDMDLLETSESNKCCLSINGMYRNSDGIAGEIVLMSIVLLLDIFSGKSLKLYPNYG